MMTKEGSTKKYNFHDTLGRGFCARVWPCKSYSLKCITSLKISSLLPGKDQTNYLYCFYDQGRVYQNYIFHDPRGLGSDIRAWPQSHFSEYVVSSTLSIYSTLVAIVYISFTIVDLQLFYDGAVDIQI